MGKQISELNELSVNEVVDARLVTDILSAGDYVTRQASLQTLSATESHFGTIKLGWASSTLKPGYGPVKTDSNGCAYVSAEPAVMLSAACQFDTVGSGNVMISAFNNSITYYYIDNTPEQNRLYICPLDNQHPEQYFSGTVALSVKNSVTAIDLYPTPGESSLPPIYSPDPTVLDRTIDVGDLVYMTITSISKGPNASDRVCYVVNRTDMTEV